MTMRTEHSTRAATTSRKIAVIAGDGIGVDVTLEAVKVLEQVNQAAGLDLDFHREIWRHCGNSYLVSAIENIVVPLFAHRVLWRINREITGWSAILVKQHNALVDFVLGNIQQPAEEVMIEHLSYRFTLPARFSSYGLAPAEHAAAPVKA